MSDGRMALAREFVANVAECPRCESCRDTAAHLLAKLSADPLSEHEAVLVGLRNDIAESRREIAAMPADVTIALAAFDACLRMLDGRLASLRAKVAT